MKHQTIRKLALVLALFTLLLLTVTACDTSHTVAFAGEGITPPEAQTVKSGDCAIKPADPVRTGYTFLGWYAEGAESAFNFETPIKGDVTLTARFEEKAAYTVSFTGEGVNASSVTVYDGDAVSAPETPAREGYSFVAWTKAGEDSAYDFSSPVTGDLTLVAKWTRNLVTVTYRPENGTADVTTSTPQGAPATEPQDPEKAGYTFLYWVKEGESDAYDFTVPVTEDLTLVAVYERTSVRLRFEGDDIADFRFDGVTPRTAYVGDTVTFRLWISPYYTGEPRIDAGGAAVKKDGDVYSFVVESAVTVRISGLRRENTTLEGRGTRTSPYLIRNASQLKTFADAINGGGEQANKYNTAHLRLETDLSLGGVTFDPIGSAQSSFRGTFDGAGHTVSNFRLNATSGTVGFFGYVIQGTVRDLRLVADLTVDASAENTNYVIGPVVAYNLSSDVIGCSFDGSLRVRFSGSTGAVAYVGGICGFVQGYSTDYTGTVSYCRVGATLTSDGTRPVTALGGIAGTLYGTADSAPAYIYNCTYAGEIGGKSKRSGGIAGFLRTRSSLANCFASGKVEAKNTDDVAAAGALVGEAANETSLTNSAASALVSAVGKESETYERTPLVGIRAAAGGTTIDSRAAVSYRNYYAENGAYTEGGRTYSFSVLSDLVDLLAWHTPDWKMTDGVLIPDRTGLDSVEIHATFVFGKNVTREGLTLSADAVSAKGYAPVYWAYDGSGMNNFTADDGTISYGYFLDEARTVRVPSSMILTEGMTLYVGFESYENIAGEYYAVINGKEVKLTLDNNGKLTMYVEGLLANYVYVYDGSHILIRNGYFAYLQYPEFAKTYDLDTDYYAEITAKGLLIYDTVFFTESKNNRLLAVAATEVLGTWYGAGDTVYTFRADGTGTIDNGSEFTYSVSGSLVTLTVGGRNYSVTVSGDTMSGGDLVLRRFDSFRGTWESEFRTKKTVSFDGKGTLTTPAGDTRSYTVSNGVLTFEGGSATFDENGLLLYTENGKTTTYGREGSFIGYWVETQRDYHMELYGIGRDGYGTGRDTNGALFTYVAEWLTDEKTGEGSFYVTMYYRTSMYGYFGLVTEKETTGDKEKSEMLYLAVFTPGTGYIVDDYNMCYRDPFYGTFHTPDGISLEFNGFGAYHVDYHGTSGDWIVIGYVNITLPDGTVTKAEYRYKKSTGCAEFTYKNKTYTVSLTDDGIAVSDGEGNSLAGYEPDALADLAYRAKDGTFCLSFNGKSNAGYGVATIIFADGTETTFSYTCTASADEVVATLTGDSGVAFILTVTQDAITGSGAEGDIDFGIYHILGGRTYLLGAGIYLSIGAVSDAGGHFTGTFGGEAVDFYYIDKNNLAMYSGTELIYYIVYQDENVAALFDESLNLVTVVVTDDDLGGTYIAADGSTLTLDGRSYGAKYVYASAILNLADDEEDPTVLDLVYAREEDGTYTLSEVDNSGTTPVPTPLYRLSLTEREGAVAYTMTNADGTSSTVWLLEITEEA